MGTISLCANVSHGRLTDCRLIDLDAEGSNWLSDEMEKTHNVELINEELGESSIHWLFEIMNKLM